ncbi:SRP54-type protein [Protomyces lactucae-debilis]|uniref:Signal recognition particle receptor subunit alpha homolog n=1 Tax=Protomyces lactucae-debilis TaxID=2754530 RepID=A0A1Y2FAN6_PROLT|nr:SRP54-type protein [Protomyces lactucae-debilis]ORY80968.1 SRP54-type protein [Protomyces lactucae-debilis]
MLDLFTIVNQGGVVLWQKQLSPVSNAVVNGLITDIFIAGSSASTYAKSGYTVKWTHANELGLIFVVVYQSLLQLGFVEEFLDNMKRIVRKLYATEIKKAQTTGADLTNIVVEFDVYFDQRLRDLEAAPEAQSPPHVAPEVSKSPQPRILTAAKLVGGRRAATKRGSGRSTPVNGNTSSVPTSDDETTKPKTKAKVQRKWRADGTLDESGTEVLDFSVGDSGDVNTNIATDVSDFVGNDAMQKTKQGQMVIQDLGEMLAQETPEAPKTGAFSFFSKLVVGKTLTAEDLDPVMESMRQHLLAKNVANEVCVDLCASVKTSLVGQKTGSFGKTSTMVRTAMEQALKRILTPTTSLDLLNEVARVNTSEKRPYTMSFIGVNGVGKSTNLSKIAYWLLGNKLRVLIVACDTFRSGAVEQLRVHVTRLRTFIESQGRSGDGVELFERGYGKDPSSIANDAITYAKKNGFEVVLVDTAGRRHNDARLMSGLERFVSTVKLDKVFQVAEALVGTDSLSQARHFNDALGPKRNLDGFIISKVDTVGDLVGTIVSMIYVTGVPVLFVGVGQMYTDLRGLSVSWVLQMLMQ